MTKIIDFKDVELYYDHVYALKGVSIEVNEGETVALIGANGAGKSSILRAITGLAPIKSGEIHYCGQRLDGTPAAEIVPMGISMVPEGRRVFPFMSVQDNLLMGAFTRNDPIEIQRTLDSVLERFPRLRERFKQQAGTLSGGEQQMIAVARAMMAKPKMLLLDEPSMGLAPQLVAEIFHIVKELNEKEGVSILLAEQNTNVALRNADYGYIIETGNVMLEGSAKDLLNNEKVKELYLGISKGKRLNFKDAIRDSQRKKDDAEKKPH